MGIAASLCRADPHCTDTHIAHWITIEIQDLPSDHRSRVHVKDHVSGALPRLYQDSPLLTAGRLNEAGVLDHGQVSTRFNIVDLESAIHTGRVGILTIRLTITRDELHICFSHGLASWLLQDLTSYRYARSLLLRGTLKCEGGRHEARSSDE